MKPGEIAHNVTRGALFLTIEKGAAVLSTMVYIALLARWLGPTKYGVFSLAFAVIGLATALSGNAEVFLERYTAEYQAHGRLRLLGRAYAMALGLKTVLGLGAAAIVLALTPMLAEHYRMPELGVLLPVLTLFVASDGLATTGRAVLYGLQRFEWMSAVSLVFNIGKTLLVALLWFAQKGLVELAVGLTALNLLQALLICLAANHMIAQARRDAPEVHDPEEDAPLFRPMLRYCLPLLGARAAFLSGQNLGKLVLARVLDATTLGYYSFAFQTVERFIELVHTLPASLLPSLTQLVARRENERLRHIFDQAFRLIQLSACVLTFVLFAFAHELTLWLGSPLFLPAVPMLRVLALVPMVRTAQQPLTMLFQALRRPGYVLALAVAKLGGEVLGYLVLLPLLGAMGAAVANLMGAVVAYAGALWLMRIALPEGSWQRLGDVLRAMVLVIPGLLWAIVVDLLLPPSVALPLRVAAIVPGGVAIFALGLVTRHDLEKLVRLELPAAWQRRSRDAIVGRLDHLAQVFENRGAS